MQLKTKLILLLFVSTFYLSTKAQTVNNKDKVVTLKTNQSISLDRPDASINKSTSTSSKYMRIENPFLNCSPNKELDVNSWSAKTSRMLKAKPSLLKQSNTAKANSFVLNEQETFFDRTNGFNTPQLLSGLGSSKELKQNVLIKGAFNSSIANAKNFPVTNLDITEGLGNDNGSIDLAQKITLSDAQIDNYVGSGVIGDGPHGSSGTGSGDHDYYMVDLKEGDLLRIAVNSTDSENIIFPNIRVFFVSEGGGGFGFGGGFLDSSNALFVAGNARQFFFFDGEEVVNVRPRSEKGEVVYLVESTGSYAIEITDGLQEDIQFTTTIDPDTSRARIRVTQVEDEFTSGDEFGFGNEGAYDMEINVLKTSSQDQDFYEIALNKGDVLGVSLDLEDVDVGSGFLAPDGITIIGGVNISKRFSIGLTDPNGEVQVITNNIASLFPSNSPLPEIGESNFSYVAPQSGMYQIALGGNAGAYDLRITATDPGLELNKGQKQFIYLDFTGAEITLREVLGSRTSDLIEASGIDDDIEALDIKRNLSPFENFLENWGIKNNRRNRTKLTQEIAKVVAENLRADLIESQINPNLDLVIVSDYGSPFLGNKIPELLEKFKVPYSRVIVGGTIDELNISTIGIASAIDPGNYSLNDEAVVLLDVLSESGKIPGVISLNEVPLAEGIVIEDLVTVAVGNIVAHEAGHFLGSFHTEPTNDTFSIMDQGGILQGSFGITPSGVFGQDATDVDFVKDNYASSEFPLFSGQNHTDVNTAFALSFLPKRRFYSKQNNSKVVGSTEDIINQLEQSVLESLDNRIVNLDATVYPNPISLQNTNEVNVSFNVSNNGVYKVELYSLGGQKVATIFEDSVSNESRKIVRFSPQQHHLVSGVYICKISTPENNISKKIIIN